MATPPEKRPGRYGALAWAVHDLALAAAEADVAMSARIGVTAGDYLAIKHVMTRSGELGPVALGRLLGMTSGAATSLVDRLEVAGHLSRTPHPTDRRRQVLVVSASTRSAVAAALAPLGDALDQLAATYDATQRRDLEAFLRAVLDVHRSMTGAP